MYYSDFSYLFDLLGWSVALGGLLQLALYVAESLGLYAMARNTGVHNPWFAWLPIARDYLIGELSDRYNLSSRQKKGWMRVLLTTLSAVQLPLGLVGVLLLFIVVSLFVYSMPVLLMIVVMLSTLLALVGVAYKVCYLVSFYYVMMDYEPSRAVLYTILAFLELQAIPLLLCRNNVPVGIAGRREPTQPKYDVHNPSRMGKKRFTLERKFFTMNKSLRKAIVAGNWKMNNDRKAAKALITELAPMVKDAGCEVVLCVPFTNLETALSLCEGTNLHVGAQNCHWAASGAFTGEISAQMLAEMGVEYVIIGHSERRQYFGETDQTVNARTRAALDAGLKVILCVGEVLEQREQGVTEEVVSMQTKIALGGVSEQELQNIVIAYEPVWAIGTGKTATADQAEEVCAIIRGVVEKLYHKAAADAMTIQYGGSMKPGNAKELLEKEDVDGGLIGGAALKAQDFAAIVEAAK